ncbi:hypothetical protein [Planococcus sp. ISL-110]|nr:hypothetical protein [Planococcus sp. ISL-110]MBT2571117.1 hypothetical protein [Planococcus sp. ISL-110]
MGESEDLFSRKSKEERRLGEPTAAFKGAAWGALLIGVSAYSDGSQID